MTTIHSISLYDHSGPKALIMPHSAELVANFLHPALTTAGKEVRDGGCRIKFEDIDIFGTLFSDTPTQQVILNLIQAMQNDGNKRFMCSADLNISGSSAGTLFFQQDTTPCRGDATGPVEMACLQLDRKDKLRVIQLPEGEIAGLQDTLRSHWKREVETKQKDGTTSFKLGGRPWAAFESSDRLRSVDAHRLILQLFHFMSGNGWRRVVTFGSHTFRDKCSDSILFYRGEDELYLPPQTNDARKEFVAISLENHHEIRLIGCGDGDITGSHDVLDGATKRAFQSAVEKHTSVRELSVDIDKDSFQIKCHDNLWHPGTTEQYIASGRLMCGVLQAMYDQGWKWHCALDMSTSVADKSSFFLSRSNSGKSHAAMATKTSIGCIQAKGHGKVNILSFPPKILKQVMVLFESATWYKTSIQKIDYHGMDSATLKFDNADNLHFSQYTEEKVFTTKLYNQILSLVLGCQTLPSSTIEWLGSGNIDGSCTMYRNEVDEYGSSMDLDCFFFKFDGNS